jgi:hypothetical protein
MHDGEFILSEANWQISAQNRMGRECVACVVKRRTIVHVPYCQQPIRPPVCSDLREPGRKRRLSTQLARSKLTLFYSRSHDLAEPAIAGAGRIGLF